MIQYYYVLALKARTDYMFCAGFFHTRKNLKNFSKEVIKSHLSFPIWCGKRDKHFSNHKGKEVRLMKPSDFQKTVQCRFESCLKKVVRSVVKDYYKELNRRKNKEIEYSCAMKSHFRKFGNQMSGSGNHLCNYASLLA